MTESAAALLKSRLRADLTAALKAREKLQAALLRDLIAAIDNAEAVPIPANAAWQPQDFLTGAAEIARIDLGPEQVRDIMKREIIGREDAAAGYDRLGRPDMAAKLRAEAELARHYL